MPSWFINTLWTLAAGFILVVTGCFIAGMVSEARGIGAERAVEIDRQERERKVKDGYAQMFTDMDRRLRDAEVEQARADLRWQLMKQATSINQGFYDMRQMLQADEDTLTAWQRENIRQSIVGNANANVVGDNNVVTTFYANNGPYVTIPEPYGTEERK